MSEVAADAPFSAIAAIRARMGALPSGEARVAQAILDQPYAAIGWSAQELAEVAGTSSPTVVRACRRLGFAGLPELRLALAREVGWARLGVDTPSEGADAVAALFASTAQALQDIARHLDAAAFMAAAAAITEAERVLFVCAGPTQVVCRDAMFDLNSIGRTAEYSDDPIVQRMLAGHLGEGDVCIAAGLSGENELTIQAAEAAKAAGARLVTLTGASRSSLSQLGDVRIHLSAPGTFAQTHGTAILVSMIVAFRAITATIAPARGATHPAPLSDILDSTLMRSGRRLHGH